MQNKSKYSWVIGIILIIIALIYLFNLKKEISEPVEVVSPEGYEEGTTLTMYEGLPPSFPRELLLEKKKLEFSNVLVLPSGKTQIHFSYKTDKNMMQVFDLYKYDLIGKQWKLITDANNPKVATISGSKETEKLIITIIAEEAGSSVTFQHEK